MILGKRQEIYCLGDFFIDSISISLFFYMMKRIESLQNPLIKHLVQLQAKSKIRKQTQTFLIEGVREISLTLKGGYELETALFSSEIISETEVKKAIPKNVELIE